MARRVPPSRVDVNWGGTPNGGRGPPPQFNPSPTGRAGHFFENFLISAGSSEMLFSRGREFAALAAWMTALSAMAFAEEVAADPTRNVASVAVGRPALLNDAFNALLEHQGRWAYTETHHGARDGKSH